MIKIEIINIAVLITICMNVLLSFNKVSLAKFYLIGIIIVPFFIYHNYNINEIGQCIYFITSFIIVIIGYYTHKNIRS